MFVEGGGEKISPAAAESVDILKAIDYDQLDRDCDCEVCSLLCIGISGSRKERSQADRRDDDNSSTRKADKRRRPPSPVLAHSAFYLSPAVAVEAVASQFLPPHRIALFHVSESE